MAISWKLACLGWLEGICHHSKLFADVNYKTLTPGQLLRRSFHISIYYSNVYGYHCMIMIFCFFSNHKATQPCYFSNRTQTGPFPWSCFIYNDTNMIKITFSTHRDPFYQYGLNLIPERISNHMLSKLWDEIILPFPNLNGAALIVWEWINSLYHMLQWIWLLIHVGIEVKPYL